MIHHKYLLAAGLGLVVTCGIVCIKYHSPLKTQNSEAITNRLDTIQAQLGIVHQEVKKPHEVVDLTVINQDFNKLTSLIEQLKSNDEATLNHLIHEHRTELAQKLDSLHDIVTALDKKQHPIKYLPVTSLPFKVISIDSIQQVSVATVAYNFKTTSLEKSDNLAGWTVINIDFGLQRMELENSNREHVVVALDVMQGESNA
ncbi:TPA: hypothetical protein OUZ96_000369 [Legionella pneumophila]|nr:hypothetical protein [Legionella pneumophila subsp. pneumophila]HAU3487142.1 hypothetical protein [Legionella pneumophila]HAT8869662.1 hypothetical protein [Legionella pneumophila subsp. pneumophila]HAU3496705.1 hypothetical protein [Legionella pneumophila]HCU6104787.1 hypothetical protein [Legionella pneumophila]